MEGLGGWENYDKIVNSTSPSSETSLSPLKFILCPSKKYSGKSATVLVEPRQLASISPCRTTIVTISPLDVFALISLIGLPAFKVCYQYTKSALLGQAHSPAVPPFADFPLRIPAPGFVQQALDNPLQEHFTFGYGVAYILMHVVFAELFCI